MRRSRAGWVAATAGAVAAAVLAVPTGPAYGSGPAGDWKQADHDASANRANTTETTITPANVGRVGWRRGLVAAPPTNEDCPIGWSAPVLANGRAYAAGADRLVVSDLATGATVWQRPLGPLPVVYESSRVYAISGGRVFVGSLDCLSSSDPGGRVRAYDAVSGAQLWTASVDGLRGLAVSGDRVVAVGYTGGAAYTDFQVLSASTGAVVWRPDLGEGCEQAANPIVVYDRVYYRTCADARVRAARLTDGAVAWTSAIGVPVRGDAVGTTAKHLYAGNVAVNPATGATRFALSGATRVHAVDDTRVYATCGPVFCAFNRATGARLWTSTERSDSDYWEVEPALAGALLYTPRGAVLNAATGAPVAQLWLGEASGLSVGNGYVAVVVDDRVLDLYSLPGR